MSLRDTNLRYAALKLIADTVDKAMKDEKAAHLDALEASAEESGAKSWTVTLGGEKVAAITLSQRSGGYRITDEVDLADHLALAHPDMVETVIRIKPWAAKQLLESVVDVTEDGAVTKDGEILPGIEEAPAGAPYQSLRWDKDKGETAGSERGRRVIADALQAGELRELLADIPLLER